MNCGPRLVALVIILAMLPVFVACANSALAAPPPTPTATPKGWTPPPSPTRTATATATPDSSFPDLFGPDALPTLISAFPTAPAAPEGEPAILSAADLEGDWEGWMTFEAVTFDKAPAEAQQGCDQMMGALQNKALPLQMRFQPIDATSGTVRAITLAEETGSAADEQDLPYTYEDGILVIEKQEDSASVRYEARAVDTGESYTMAGTWQMGGPVSTTPTAEDKGNMNLEGTWVLSKAK